MCSEAFLSPGSKCTFFPFFLNFFFSIRTRLLLAYDISLKAVTVAVQYLHISTLLYINIILIIACNFHVVDSCDQWLL